MALTSTLRLVHVATGVEVRIARSVRDRDSARGWRGWRSSSSIRGQSSPCERHVSRNMAPRRVLERFVCPKIWHTWVPPIWRSRLETVVVRSGLRTGSRTTKCDSTHPKGTKSAVHTPTWFRCSHVPRRAPLLTGRFSVKMVPWDRNEEIESTISQGSVDTMHCCCRSSDVASSDDGCRHEVPTSLRWHSIGSHGDHPPFHVA